MRARLESTKDTTPSPSQRHQESNLILIVMTVRTTDLSIENGLRRSSCRFKMCNVTRWLFRVGESGRSGPFTPMNGENSRSCHRPDPHSLFSIKLLYLAILAGIMLVSRDWHEAGTHEPNRLEESTGMFCANRVRSLNPLMLLQEAISYIVIRN